MNFEISVIKTVLIVETLDLQVRMNIFLYSAVDNYRGQQASRQMEINNDLHTGSFFE